MAIVGRAKYTHARVRNFEETRRELARPVIAIAKIRDHAQSINAIEKSEFLAIMC